MLPWPTTRNLMRWLIVLVIEAISCLAAQSELIQSLDGAKTRLTVAENPRASYNERLVNGLEAAEIALGFARRGTEQTTREQARQIYNAATLQVTLLIRNASGNHTANPQQVNGADGSYTIRFQPAGSGRWAPDYFDELRPVVESDHRVIGSWGRGS